MQWYTLANMSYDHFIDTEVLTSMASKGECKYLVYNYGTYIPFFITVLIPNSIGILMVL